MTGDELVFKSVKRIRATPGWFETLNSIRTGASAILYEGQERELRTVKHEENSKIRIKYVAKGQKSHAKRI